MISSGVAALLLVTWLLQPGGVAGKAPCTCCPAGNCQCDGGGTGAPVCCGEPESAPADRGPTAAGVFPPTDECLTCGGNAHPTGAAAPAHPIGHGREVTSRPVAYVLACALRR